MAAKGRVPFAFYIYLFFTFTLFCMSSSLNNMSKQVVIYSIMLFSLWSNLFGNILHNEMWNKKVEPITVLTVGVEALVK